MKYRTKLYLIFVCVALFSCLLSLGLVYVDAKDYYHKELQSHALSVAATTAALLDTDEIQKACYTENENASVLEKLTKQLSEATHRDRREDVYIMHMYLLCFSPNNKNPLVLGQSEDHSKVQAEKKDFTTFSSRLQKNLTSYYTPNEYLHDKEGIWLSAFAPIFDKEGQYLATLGVDIDVKSVESDLFQIIEIAILSLCATISIAIVIAHFLAKKVTYSLRKIFDLVDQVQEGNLSYRAVLSKNDEFFDVAEEIHGMCNGLLQRERLKMNFARYVSSAVLEKAILSNSLPKIEGERKKITVLFSDLRQFTTLAENMTPEMVLGLLNEYFEMMIEIIFKYGGTLDKFLGDGLLVEFGTPVNDIFQEKHAVFTAIEMQAALKKLSEKWQKEGKPLIEMGIGIFTGPAIVGNIGSETRMEFTAIGHAVNMAFFLQQSTKQFSVPLLIGEETALAVKDYFYLIYMGKLSIPESNEAINIYTIDPNK